MLNVLGGVVLDFYLTLAEGNYFSKKLGIDLGTLLIFATFLILSFHEQLFPVQLKNHKPFLWMHYIFIWLTGHFCLSEYKNNDIPIIIIYELSLNGLCAYQSLCYILRWFCDIKNDWKQFILFYFILLCKLLQSCIWK